MLTLSLTLALTRALAVPLTLTLTRTLTLTPTKADELEDLIERIQCGVHGSRFQVRVRVGLGRASRR